MRLLVALREYLDIYICDIRLRSMVDERTREEGVEIDLLAKTLYGLEDILAGELKELGARDIVPGRRMVAFKGDQRLLYRANIHLRTALKVLVPIAQFEAHSPDEIYQYLYDHIEWDRYLTTRSTFAIDTVVYSEQFTHSKFVAYRAKDAIADFFSDRGGRRPNVSVVDPDVLFHIHIADSVVTLALDSSGESLHKRGYRVGQTEAPLSEVLAAGILLRIGWHGQCNFLDPMCGSGTFLTEAALIALGIPPGIFRKAYAFERWKDFDADLLSEVLEEWEERPFAYRIYGSDIQPKAVAMARANVKNSGLSKYVQLDVKPFEEYSEENRPSDEGILVMNPPYGERLKPMDLERLYSSIGSTLKHAFSGWKAWVLSGSLEEGFNAIGLKHFIREKLYNGMIECELRGYELFAGKRDDHLEELRQQGLLPSQEERERYYQQREAMKQDQRAFRLKNRRPRMSDEARDVRVEREDGYNGGERRGGSASNFVGRKSAPRPKSRNISRVRNEEDLTPAGAVRMRKRERGAKAFVPRPNSERRPDGEA